jgi:beta-glucanase (GH16 family)/glycerophosphoryl diester phosphodiesterase
MSSSKMYTWFSIVFLFVSLIYFSCNSNKNAVNPSISSPKSFTKDNIVIAHRGAWKTKKLPQNSIAALKESIDLGCHGTEFDIRITADDSLVVNHDATHFGIAVESTPYKILAEKKLKNGEILPTLRSFLIEGMKNNLTTKLICEIKPSTIGVEKSRYIAQKVVDLVKDLGAEKYVEYISFSYDVLLKIKEVNPNAITQFLEGNKNPEQLKQDGINGLDYHYSVYQKNKSWIQSAKDQGLTLNAWTVNKPEDMDWFIASGFDYITTDEPELLLKRYKLYKDWSMVWNDEFNTPGLPDSTLWNYDVGGHGWGNNEKQFYLKDSEENAVVANGNLEIIALKKQYDNRMYTSAKLITYPKFSLKYGKIEVSAKLPRGKGTWPAIWMLPESIKDKTEPWPLCGEIDIMEHVGKDPNVVHVSLHSELYNHMKGTQITYVDTLDNVFDTFHKYGIEWDEKLIKFYVDDQLYFETSKGEKGRISENEGWPFDKPYYLILNLAIGGNWGGEIDNSIFPAKMTVDYVRIYKRR